MQTRDEEVKTSLNQKLSAVEEFYKTLDKLLPSGNMSDAIKQVMMTMVVAIVTVSHLNSFLTL